MADALAQSSKQKPTIGELQKQLEEMRSQMVKMQNRIAELEAAPTAPYLDFSFANVSFTRAPRESQALPSNTLRIP